MNFNQYEVEIIKSTIDLAASTKGIKSITEGKDYISFYNIANAFRDVCYKLKVDKSIEQKCYQILLKMSAESENHLTWWEKFKLIHKYLPMIANKNYLETTTKNLVRSRSLPTPSQHLMKLFEPEKTIHIKPSKISSTSPGTLYEGQQLSILLNESPSVTVNNNNSPSKYSSPTIFSKSRHVVLGESDYINNTGSRRIHFSDETNKTGISSATTVKRNTNQDMLENIAVKIDSIEKETLRTKDIIARITGHVHSSPDDDHTTVTHHDAATTPIANSTPHTTFQQQNQTDWTLSPSAIHSILDMETPDGNRNHTVNKKATYEDSPSQSYDTTNVKDEIYQNSSTRQANNSEARLNEDTHPKNNHSSKAFSLMLRNSHAMTKYLSVSSTAGHVIPSNDSMNSKHSSQEIMVNPEQKSVNARKSDPYSSDVATSKEQNLHVPTINDQYLQMKDLENSNHSPQKSPSNKMSMRDLRSNILSSPDTPSSYASYSPNKFNRQEHSPLKFVDTLSVVSNRSSAMINFLCEDGQLDIDKLDLDGLILQGDSDYIKTVTSSMRILLIFQHWLLLKHKKSNYLVDHHQEYHNAALILHYHFCNTNDFVTSLFGLEQWLRDKMRLIVSLNVKAYVFTTWVLNYGVTATARTHWRRRRLHRGFESFLEYGMKRRMHRKNTLHALALRRRHTNQLNMAPVLQHRSVLQQSSNEQQQSSSYLNDSSMRNNLSALELASLNQRNRKKMQEMKYATSMSVREVLHDRQHAVALFSRGGNNSETHKLKTIEYLQTQDSVALLFFFRRFYHRTVYMPRMMKVRIAHSIRTVRNSFLLWNDMWASRINLEKSQVPKIEYARECVLFVKQRQAFYKLRRNISRSKEYRKHLAQYSVRIKSKAIYLRAFYLIRCAAYVKSFLHLKQNYMKYSVPTKEFRRAEWQQRSFSIRSYFRRWRKWFKILNKNRLNYFKTNESKIIFQNLLLNHKQLSNDVIKVEEYISVNTFFTLPVVNRMYIPKQLISRTIRQLLLIRALEKLRKLGQCSRIFYSRFELRLAQYLSKSLQSSPYERLKYLHLINNSSDRILPTYFSTRSSVSNVLLQRERLLSPSSILSATSRTTSNFFHTIEPYQKNQKKRTSEEKVYKLMMMDPKSLQFRMLAMNNSHSPSSMVPSLEGFQNDYQTIQFSNTLGTMNTVVRSMALNRIPYSSVVLLRVLRTWRKFRRVEKHLNFAKEKLSLKVNSKLYKKVWLIWRSALVDEREYKYYRRRRLFQLFKNYTQQSLINTRAISKVKKYLQRSYVNRLLQYKHHCNKFRQYQAGHFYNSIVEKVSIPILRFLSHHSFLPEVLRNFLLNYKYYRFNIYRDANYIQPAWEREQNAAAQRALVKINENYELYNIMNLNHYHQADHHLDMIKPPIKLQALHLISGLKHQHHRPYYQETNHTITNTKSRTSIKPTSKVVISEYSSGIEKLEMASLFMSYWISVGLQRYHALKRCIIAFKKYKTQSQYSSYLYKNVVHRKYIVTMNTLFIHKEKRKIQKRLKIMQLRKYWIRMRVTYVEIHHKRSKGKKLFQIMFNTFRYRLTIRGFIALWKSNLRQGFKRLKEHALYLYKAQRTCTTLYKKKLLINTLKIMRKIHIISKWRLKRGQILLLWGLSSHCNNISREMDRFDAVQLFLCLRNYQIIRLHILSMKKQNLSCIIANYFKKTSELIRGFMALYAAVAIRTKKQKRFSQENNVMKERMYKHIEIFRLNHQHSFHNNYRDYNTCPILLENKSIEFSGTHWENDFNDNFPNASYNYKYSSMQRLEQLANIRKGVSLYKSPLIHLHPRNVEAYKRLHRVDYTYCFNDKNLPLKIGNYDATTNTSEQKRQNKIQMFKSSIPRSSSIDANFSSQTVHYHPHPMRSNNSSSGNRYPIIRDYSSEDNIFPRPHHNDRSIGIAIEPQPLFKSSMVTTTNEGSIDLPSSNLKIMKSDKVVLHPHKQDVTNSVTPSSRSINDNSKIGPGFLPTKHSPMHVIDRNNSNPNSRSTSPNYSEIKQKSIFFKEKQNISPLKISVRSITTNQQYIDSPDDSISLNLDEQSISEIGRVQRPRSSLHGKYHLELRQQVFSVEQLLKIYRLTKWYHVCKQKKALRIFIRNYHKKKTTNIYYQRLKYNLSIQKWQYKAMKRSILHQGFKLLRKQLHIESEQYAVLRFAWDYYCMIAMNKALKQWRISIRRKQKNTIRIKSAEYFNASKYYHLFFVSIKACRTNHTVILNKKKNSKTVMIDNSPVKVLSKSAARSLLHYHKRKPI